MEISKLRIFFHEDKHINDERGFDMNATRNQLHALIDAVDPKELNVLEQVLVESIPIDEPLPDEMKAIRTGRNEIKHGETVNHGDINWD